jgi:hypothetical protein
MPYMPWFPEPGSYVKYYDIKSKEYKFLRLMWKRAPYTYPMRLPQLAAAAKGDAITFSEINPSSTKKHRYFLYLGVKPGFQYYLWHPYDIKSLKWDEQITAISEDNVAKITYEESPYHFPTKAIALERDRYPAVQARNISGETKTPEIIWIGALYVVKEQVELTADELARLQTGQLRSYPWDFGGEL